jgi:hypothetical protein
MARLPPTSGWFEVVNKPERDGETIAVLTGPNVVDLLRGRAAAALLLDECLQRGVMADRTVLCAEIPPTLETLQIVLLHGARPTGTGGGVRDQFRYVRGYQTKCRDRNVLLKYKRGTLELQRGGGGAAAKLGVGKRRAVGSGIDMATNADDLEYLDV